MHFTCPEVVSVGKMLRSQSSVISEGSKKSAQSSCFLHQGHCVPRGRLLQGCRLYREIDFQAFLNVVSAKASGFLVFEDLSVSENDVVFDQLNPQISHRDENVIADGSTVECPPLRSREPEFFFYRREGCQSLLRFLLSRLGLPIVYVRARKIRLSQKCRILSLKRNKSGNPTFVFEDGELRLNDIEAFNRTLAVCDLSLYRYLPLDCRPGNACCCDRHRRADNRARKSQPISPSALSCDIASEYNPEREGEKRYAYPTSKGQKRYLILFHCSPVRQMWLAMTNLSRGSFQQSLDTAAMKARQLIVSHRPEGS